MTKEQLQKRFPKANPDQIRSLLSFLLSGWEIDESEPNGVDNSINIIHKQYNPESRNGYIRGDGIFRYT
jgi:hypothetical protein